LRSLVELVQAFCARVTFLVADLLRLLAGCILQGNESLAEIGATSLLQFVVSSGDRLSGADWTLIIARVDEIGVANGASLRCALKRELGVVFDDDDDDDDGEEKKKKKNDDDVNNDNDEKKDDASDGVVKDENDDDDDDDDVVVNDDVVAKKESTGAQQSNVKFAEADDDKAVFSVKVCVTIHFCCFLKQFSHFSLYIVDSKSSFIDG
jgi:hypothetical protein